MAEPLPFMTITALSKAIASKALSPVELTQTLLDRVDQYDGVTNAFIEVTAELALKAARKAESEVMNGLSRGPLHGIPVGLKDIIDLAGYRTTAHSHQLIDNWVKEDAVVTAKLKEAGAIILGKLSTHEFAMGGPSFDLPFPPARNPWNREHFSGGSSSGSGAAVAAGFMPAALGTDTGGSIRLPAAFCGIVGLKPTYGLVSRRGVLPLSQSLDHIGPMTWTVEDNALLLDVLAGHDPLDPASADRPYVSASAGIHGGVKGLRVAYLPSLGAEAGASDEVMKGVAHVAETLKSLGAIVEEVTLPPLMDFASCGNMILSSEAFAIHEPNIRQRPEKYGEILRDRLFLAGFVHASDYVHAMKMRGELVATVAKVMRTYDVIICASAATPAPKIKEMPKFGLYTKPPLTFPFNVTGMPSLSMCCGYSASGLPLAVQIAGHAFEEATVYRVAQAYEATTTWRSRRPDLDAGLKALAA
ncbi:MAG: Asp-tRNA(Asn)/Glu-tRNA(Gln) amidotransferase GatCAB subunit A [Rhizobiales bacterium PAR1]|nr:MAG: Asp-tRNA(Asn)/Glu-tRNA(Gln) amidotransferase GatCAB subunit A [Rhizobiales bacterium PAR1]